MAPSRILIIRHAEKPDAEAGIMGVDASGRQDIHSLSIRGWQRAGALARLFCPRAEAELSGLMPDSIFAAGIGTDSESRRPQQTIAPLAALLRETKPSLPLVTAHLNHQTGQLVEDLTTRAGIVLVSWEHRMIPEIVRRLPDAPSVPHLWPGDRYDLIWLLDRNAHGWMFRQIPQLLLDGDHDGLIM